MNRSPRAFDPVVAGPRVVIVDRDASVPPTAAVIALPGIVRPVLGHPNLRRSRNPNNERAGRRVAKSGHGVPNPLTGTSSDPIARRRNRVPPGHRTKASDVPHDRLNDPRPHDPMTISPRDSMKPLLARSRRPTDHGPHQHQLHRDASLHLRRVKRGNSPTSFPVPCSSKLTATTPRSARKKVAKNRIRKLSPAEKSDVRGGVGDDAAVDRAAKTRLPDQSNRRNPSRLPNPVKQRTTNLNPIPPRNPPKKWVTMRQKAKAKPGVHGDGDDVFDDAPVNPCLLPKSNPKSKAKMKAKMKSNPMTIPMK